MANIKSQIKRNRTNEAARERNKAVRSAVKTRTKHAERAIAEGADDAAELTKAAIKSIDKAATKGVFHKNAAARRKARLMRDLNAANARTPRSPTDAAPSWGGIVASAGTRPCPIASPSAACCADRLAQCLTLCRSPRGGVGAVRSGCAGAHRRDAVEQPLLQLVELVDGPVVGPPAVRAEHDGRP